MDSMNYLLNAVKTLLSFIGVIVLFFLLAWFLDEFFEEALFEWLLICLQKLEATSCQMSCFLVKEVLFERSRLLTSNFIL